jgi:SAM-dependent methyltransferase
MGTKTEVESRFERLAGFLETAKADTYPEPPSGLHGSITRQMVERIGASPGLPPGARVLDVGCGQGVALQLFEQRGYRPVGITLNAEDASICRAQGFPVRQMDQSFLEFAEEEFDLVWCRHCLEHSIFPFFTLAEFRRVLKPGGWLYVEVPAPDTVCRHQTNRNHYSVLGRSMWIELLGRSGFELKDVIDIRFTLQAGPDLYWAFLGKKS